jgi:hypothetical protein
MTRTPLFFVVLIFLWFGFLPVVNALEYPADGLGPFSTNWLNGTPNPDTALGFNGDYYLKDNGMVFHKSSGTWSFVTYLNGTPGAMVDYTGVNLNISAGDAATLSTVNGWFTTNGSAWQAAVLSEVNGWFPTNNSATQASTLSVVSSWFTANNSATLLTADQHISTNNTATQAATLSVADSHISSNVSALEGEMLTNRSEVFASELTNRTADKAATLLTADLHIASNLSVNNTLVSGPTSATTDNIVTFASTTGRVVEDGLQTINQVISAAAVQAVNTAGGFILSNRSALEGEIATNASATLLTADQHISTNSTADKAAALSTADSHISSNMSTLQGEILTNRSAIETEMWANQSTTSIWIGQNISAEDTRVAQNSSADRAYTNTNASNWLSVTNARFAYSNKTILTSGTGAPGATFILNSTTHLIFIEILAGGGGGGGGSNVASAFGGGGGAGGYVTAWVQVVPSTLLHYNIMTAAVPGGTTAGTTGQVGYATNITNITSAWYVNCTGGGGGVGQTGTTTVATVLGGAGGSCITLGVPTGQILFGMNQSGTNGVRQSATFGVPSIGAPSPYSPGARAAIIAPATATTGVNCIGFGGGGSGGDTTTTTGAAGGKGCPGLIIVTEYS